MLIGAGLLSKFVELVAGKLIGKRLDLALDEKRLACYSFVELYFIMQGFASITKRFIAQLEESGFEPWMTINPYLMDDPQECECNASFNVLR